MSNAKDKAEHVLNAIGVDEETLIMASRSAYDQNPDLMTPKEILLFVLYGYVEEPPKDDEMPEVPDSMLENCDIEEPI